MKTKEIYWPFGISFLIVILYIFTFGLDGLLSNTLLDINIHDTYYVISQTHLLLLIFILIFWLVYLVRMLVNRFQKLMINLIFMIANSFLIFILVRFSSMSDQFGSLVFNIGLVTIVFLISLLGLAAFKTGQAYQKSRK